MTRATRIAAASALALAASGAWAQKTELLVYTALETDQLKAYTESFVKQNPNIELKFVRDSTGVITARILAEKANPQADAILGVAASSMEIFKGEGESAFVGRAGRVRRGRLLQHGRGTEEGDPQARVVAGPAEARLQGPDHDAQSRV
jgi:hypothetical protein